MSLIHYQSACETVQMGISDILNNTRGTNSEDTLLSSKNIPITFGFKV